MHTCHDVCIQEVRACIHVMMYVFDVRACIHVMMCVSRKLGHAYMS